MKASCERDKDGTVGYNEPQGQAEEDERSSVESGDPQGQRDGVRKQTHRKTTWYVWE